MPYPLFDRSKLKLKPLSERMHDITVEDLLNLKDDVELFDVPELRQISDRIKQARKSGHHVVLVMGAHVIKRGLSRFVIDLMERGIITHVCTNGAGTIHDFELALIGATSESVARYIQEGQFGLWKETGGIIEAVERGISFSRMEARVSILTATIVLHCQICIGWCCHEPCAA